MSLRDMVKSYSGESATATPATSATHRLLRVATVAAVATVAVATSQTEQTRLIERWKWFLSLSIEHGIHPDVVAAEFPTEDDRLDVIEPSVHDDETLRLCMATLYTDVRVRQRQQNYEAGTWVPVNPDGEVMP